MRGPDSYNESLFTTVPLEHFVPANHPLRPIRARVNQALAAMDAKFSAMYEADITDIKGGRLSSAPEKLMRAMLLQVLCSVRSEQQLVEQIQDNLLFRWFVDLAIEETVWNHSVFSKNRDRLIECAAVTELFNAMVQMADERGLLSGEHFNVEGTLIEAWVSNKSMRRKNGSDDSRPPDDWREQPGINDAHACSSDPDARLYRKSQAAPALPSYLGHVLTENRHGLVVNVQVSVSDGTPEREVAAQMLADVVTPGRTATVGVDKTEDTRGFVKACRQLGVSPHVAQNTNRSGGSVINKRTTRHAGYAISQRKTKCIK